MFLMLMCGRQKMNGKQSTSLPRIHFPFREYTFHEHLAWDLIFDRCVLHLFLDHGKAARRMKIGMIISNNHAATHLICP